MAKKNLEKLVDPLRAHVMRRCSMTLESFKEERGCLPLHEF
jgi:hypothetical protein